MGQTEKVEKAPKASWFSGVKAEFAKIVWPEQKSVVMGLIIALIDWVIQYGVNFLIGLNF